MRQASVHQVGVAVQVRLHHRVINARARLLGLGHDLQGLLRVVVGARLVVNDLLGVDVLVAVEVGVPQLAGVGVLAHGAVHEGIHLVEGVGGGCRGARGILDLAGSLKHGATRGDARKHGIGGVGLLGSQPRGKGVVRLRLGARQAVLRRGGLLEGKRQGVGGHAVGDGLGNGGVDARHDGVGRDKRLDCRVELLLGLGGFLVGDVEIGTCDKRHNQNDDNGNDDASLLGARLAERRVEVLARVLLVDFLDGEETGIAARLGAVGHLGSHKRVGRGAHRVVGGGELGLLEIALRSNGEELLGLTGAGGRRIDGLHRHGIAAVGLASGKTRHCRHARERVFGTGLHGCGRCGILSLVGALGSISRTSLR